MNNMDALREQLMTSLRVFLFLDTYAPRDLDMNQPICEIKMNEEECLYEALVNIAINRWQIHHAYHIKQPDITRFSIAELADLALASERLAGKEYQRFVDDKMDEISVTLREYLQDSFREQGVIEEAEYLMNLN
ncbi:MAG: hypothetical protein MK198_06825 [Gracilimonas sp.]|uniref:hypothetical protein n=1 Tax=Gracilimonas sp. TaxID=1974203 RepID=UPI0037518883|nr:hypothetical protein [Gracilimonas sp.]